jgi:hypothetical protein
MTALKSPSKFSRTDTKYLVDTLMFLCILGIAGVGLLLAFIIPEGQAGGRSKYFLGVHRHQWGHIHLYLSLAFSALLLIHIIVSWSWIRGKARQYFKGSWKTALALTVVAALLIPVVFWLATPKNVAESSEEMGSGPRGGGGTQGQEALGTGEKASAGRGAGAEGSSVISGRMTLGDIERQTGVSVRDIAAKVGLPEDVSRDETLGQLRQRYRFEIQAIRDAVAELLKSGKK